MLDDLRREMRALANDTRAKNLSRFFKTGKGEYGEGDKFLGISVPQSRTVVKKYKDLPLDEVEALFKSKIHEERLVAVLILVSKFTRGNEQKKQEIFDFYLSNTKYINNWDLVDLSAGYIVGAHLLDKKRDILIKLAKSQSLWERRIAMIATFAFIYNGESEWSLKIAEILLSDEHDLIQKAVGWMLREVGKRVSQVSEEEFINRNYDMMGRTCLRYAIERFPEKKRKEYLHRKNENKDK